MKNLILATFTSVWDGGYEITSDCKINPETHEIVEIEEKEGIVDGEEVEILDREYVTVNGEDFPAYDKSAIEGVGNSEAYWYN